MTYRLNSELRKISSSVKVLFPNGETFDYSDGSALVNSIFDRPYCIHSIAAKQDMIVIVLEENDTINDTTWSKSEVSFF